jgi:transcriptional regulator with XRE-family HTH domain
VDKKLEKIKAKKVGLFMREAREKKEQTIDNCATWLNIGQDEYLAMEEGKSSPSLPQLESLANFLNSSFDFLLHGPSTEVETGITFSQDVNINLLTLRNHVIAALIKQSRLEKNISLDKLSELSSIPSDVLQSYENGATAIPVITLENLIEKLEISWDKLFSQTGPLAHGSVPVSPSSVLPAELPEDMREFISKPVNRPYLDLAMRLSKMEADKLRSIAASLLEITY